MKTVCLLVCIFITSFGFSQKRDSLLNIIKHSTNEMKRLNALSDFLISETEANPAEAVALQKKMLQEARAKKDKPGELIIIGSIGYSIALSGNMAAGTDMLFKGLKMAEDLNNQQLIGMVYCGLGNLYTDVAKQKEYYQKSLTASAVAKDSLFMIAELGNLSSVYITERKMDSALYYNQRCEELARAAHQPVSRILIRSGYIHYYAERKQVALEFYRAALQEAEKNKNADEGKRSAFYALSWHYLYESNIDSALYYSKLYYNAVKDGYLIRRMGATLSLARVYEKVNSDSALNYTKQYMAMKDSVYGLSKVAQMQSMALLDDERQYKSTEERKHNLQYAAIAFGLIAFIILFFVFSHSIIANQKLIRFLGIIALLIVFEFLNLLLHPWLGAVTHHSPILMLLAMVCVAALLIPMHHKLEHWITHRLVEKNKKIRVAAAKKIIQQLEPEHTN